MTNVLEKLMHAVEAVDAIDYEMWDNIGGHLTCKEAEAVSDLLVELGLVIQADRLFDAHQRSDEDGDEHYEGDA